MSFVIRYMASRYGHVVQHEIHTTAIRDFEIACIGAVYFFTRFLLYQILLCVFPVIFFTGCCLTGFIFPGHYFLCPH